MWMLFNFHIKHVEKLVKLGIFFTLVKLLKIRWLNVSHLEKVYVSKKELVTQKDTGLTGDKMFDNFNTKFFYTHLFKRLNFNLSKSTKCFLTLLSILEHCLSTKNNSRFWVSTWKSPEQDPVKNGGFRPSCRSPFLDKGFRPSCRSLVLKVSDLLAGHLNWLLHNPWNLTISWQTCHFDSRKVEKLVKDWKGEKRRSCDEKSLNCGPGRIQPWKWVY